MDKTLFKELKESIIEAGKIKRGELPPSRRFVFDAPDVKAIRRKLALSQNEFAGLMGVSVDTLQNWEQGRRRPEGPAMALLKVVDVNPKAVLGALRA